MRIHENSWEFMRIHENSWEFMRIHENSWEFMRIHENSWEFMRIHENSWEFMRIHENSWEWMRMNENEWEWMRMNENEWEWMRMNENEWEWMRMNENKWELMRINSACPRVISHWQKAMLFGHAWKKADLRYPANMKKSWAWCFMRTPMRTPCSGPIANASHTMSHPLANRILMGRFMMIHGSPVLHQGLARPSSKGPHDVAARSWRRATFWRVWTTRCCRGHIDSRWIHQRRWKPSNL